MPRAFSALNSLLREHSSAARHAQSVSGDVHERHGFDPDQPRIPADSSHGGEWTASDGSVSDARVLSDALPANDWLPGAQYASARGRGAGPGRMEPGQATRLAVAQDRARKAMDRVRQIDPDWKPQFSVSQTNEGLIRSFEARAQEAEARLDALSRIGIGPGPFATESVPARGPERNFTDWERSEINRIFEQSGCHTCGTFKPGTRYGNAVADHQPPNALNHLNLPQRLFPQCLICSNRQGGFISSGEWKK